MVEQGWDRLGKTWQGMTGYDNVGMGQLWSGDTCILRFIDMYMFVKISVSETMSGKAC